MLGTKAAPHNPLNVLAHADWKEFMFHLEDRDFRREGRLAKVLIVFLTESLFTSKPCLREIHAAVTNKLRIIPLRVEDVDLETVAWWKDQVQNDSDLRVMRNEVERVLMNVNSVPAPGSVVEDDLNTLDVLLAIVRTHIGAPMPSSGPEASDRGEEGAAQANFPEISLRATYPLLVGEGGEVTGEELDSLAPIMRSSSGRVSWQRSSSARIVGRERYSSGGSGGHDWQRLGSHSGSGSTSFDEDLMSPQSAGCSQSAISARRSRQHQRPPRSRSNSDVTFSSQPPRLEPLSPREGQV